MGILYLKKISISLLSSFLHLLSQVVSDNMIHFVGKLVLLNQPMIVVLGAHYPKQYDEEDTQSYANIESVRAVFRLCPYIFKVVFASGLEKLKDAVNTLQFRLDVAHQLVEFLCVFV